MSIQAVGWVLENSDATLADRLVFIAIANHADARGYNSFPSVEHIAKEARVGVSTVSRSIANLERLGELIVVRRPGRANLYGVQALLDPSQIGRGVPLSNREGPLSNTTKTPLKSRDITVVTVKEPSCARAKPTMPPALDPDTRARGAAFMKALRTGDKPA
jgi:hypothetical protein